MAEFLEFRIKIREELLAKEKEYYNSRIGLKKPNRMVRNNLKATEKDILKYQDEIDKLKVRLVP
jgi:hypothetical protein